jgi:hypothetical protein
MGYCMQQVDGSFFIASADAHKAVKAMQELGKERKWDFEFDKLDCLPDILNEWCWELDVAESGNIRGIQFTGEKSRDELDMFKAIAPFVKAGSFIEMRGEDGCMWRYVFDGTTCNEVYAKVSWEA